MIVNAAMVLREMTLDTTRISDQKTDEIGYSELFINQWYTLVVLSNHGNVIYLHTVNQDAIKNHDEHSGVIIGHSRLIIKLI